MATFEIKTVEGDDVTTLIVTGEIDLATAPSLEQHLMRAQAARDKPVVVDLDGVRFMDSTGLQVLVAHTISAPNGSRVRLTRGSPQVQRLFEISGMLEHLPFVSED